MKTRFMLILAAMLLIVPVVSAQTTTGEDDVCTPTPPDMLGPYYVEDAPETNVIFPDDAPGDRLLVHGTVYLGDCDTPLEGAVVEIWQADSTGDYDFSEDFIGRGKVETDEDGYYEFITVVPAAYEMRPPHIHYKITQEEEGVELVTQLYFKETFPGSTPNPQVTTLEEFDLDTFLEDRLVNDADVDLDEEAEEDVVTTLYEDVDYVATFDIVLVGNR